MFVPNHVIFEKASLQYEMGNRLYEYFKDKDTDIEVNNRGIFKAKIEDPKNLYAQGKNTLIVSLYKNREFESCRPSANYQLPLVSGCAAMCEYCYLNTRLSKRPYTKIYVNIDDIFNKAFYYIKERGEEVTVFEASATSDPVPLEPYTKALKSTIDFFGQQKYGRLRFVTKFTDIEGLKEANHNGNTTVRFSLNTEDIIDKYEHRTPRLLERLEAAKKVKRYGYNLGFIIAPVFLYEGYQNDYRNLLFKIAETFKDEELEFEIISHRYTSTAKNSILSIFENTTLPMNEEARSYKYGQFGYGKFVYKKEDLNNMKLFFNGEISKIFKFSSIKYII